MSRTLLRKPLVVTGILLTTLGTALPAYGYIDPGTGSLIIQSIIGAIAAIGVTMKLYCHKLKVFFAGKPKVDDSDTEEGQKSDP